MLRSPQLLLFWIAGAACAFGQLAVLRAMLAGRAPGTSRHPVARWREAAWVVLPTVVLLGVLYATWHAVQAHATTASPTAFRAHAPVVSAALTAPS